MSTRVVAHPFDSRLEIITDWARGPTSPDWDDLMPLGVTRSGVDVDLDRTGGAYQVVVHNGSVFANDCIRLRFRIVPNMLASELEFKDFCRSREADEALDAVDQILVAPIARMLAEALERICAQSAPNSRRSLIENFSRHGPIISTTAKEIINHHVGEVCPLPISPFSGCSRYKLWHASKLNPVAHNTKSVVTDAPELNLEEELRESGLLLPNSGSW